MTVPSWRHPFLNTSVCSPSHPASVEYSTLLIENLTVMDSLINEQYPSSEILCTLVAVRTSLDSLDDGDSFHSASSSQQVP